MKNEAQLEKQIYELTEEIEAKRSTLKHLKSELEELRIQSATETFGGDVQKGTILYTQTKDDDVYIIVDSYAKGSENIYGIAISICENQIFFDNSYILNIKSECRKGVKYTQVSRKKLLDTIRKFSVDLIERIKILQDWY